MKKILLAILLISSFASNAKCIVQTYASGDIIQAIKVNGFNFKGFDKVCLKINSVNARIYVTGGFLTLDGKNIATMTVQLLDTDTMLIADGNYNTYVTINSIADDSNKSRMISQTIDKAIGGWDVDAAISSLNLQRQKRKDSLKK